MAESIVNEQSTNWWVIDFTDRAGSPETPSQVSYSIHDAIDGTLLTTGTVTASTQVNIQINSTYNAIRHNRPYERRRLHVLATYGTGQLSSEISWQVRNLGFTPSTST